LTEVQATGMHELPPPQTLAKPAPPQIFPSVQAPQSSIPPQPLPMVPQ
jgi:hypothetical protein